MIVRGAIEETQAVLEGQHGLLLETAPLGRSSKRQPAVQPRRHIFEKDSGHHDHGSILVA